MENRFLYRAWDKTRREYLSAGKVMIQVNCRKSPTESPLFLDGDEYSCDDRMVLEQCTGLKCKHGKLIFEGDILRVMDWGGSSGMELGITSVIWCDDDIGWRYADGDITEDTYDQFRNVEIIGNKFENPELLEGNSE